MHAQGPTAPVAAFPPRLVLALGVVSVGVSAILIRLVGDAPALSIAFYRLLLSVVLLGVPALVWHRDGFRALSRRDLVVSLGIGVVLGVHFATWIESLFHTTVASSVIIVSLEAVLASIGAALFLRERLVVREWLFIGLAFVGVALIALGDARPDALIGGDFPNPLYGDLLAFIGAVAAAVYLVGGRSIRPRVHLLVYVTVVYGACTVTLFAMALAAEAPLWGFSARTWALFLLMALLPTLGGHTLFNWCLRYLPAATVSTAILGEPLIAAGLAALLFLEIPAPLSLVGGVLTLLGILGVVRRHPRPAAAAATEGPA